MNSSNPCSDYECNVPMPSSSFTDTPGPLCSSLAEYLYDAANCDPGYWCGCSSSDPQHCLPSNDTTMTRWAGRFTTKNITTNETIVLTGGFDGESNKCPEGYYCPGLSKPQRCVDLCVPKFYCPEPDRMLPCPVGEFCPVASVEPMSCHGLEACNEENQRRFKTGTASLVLLLVLVASIAYLFYGSYLLKKKAREPKDTKTKSKATQSMSEQDNYVDDDGEQATNGNSTTVTSPEMTIDIEFDRLQLKIPHVGTIMRGVSGKIKHGSLTAIMGPSGAGKTTFLNMMSGKVDRTGGTLKVNGEEVELSKYQKLIGFVPQEDIMLRELSVEEIVTHSALMRLPASWSTEEKLARVEEVLESLEIDHIRDSVVGDERRRGISGGQRKRVNIAMEMVTKPSLLCLDEPTSGLDSTTSFTVIQSLKDMAKAGANVITVLHQPKYEVFELFDQVLLLGKGGMTVYYGPTTEMPNYFAKRGFPCPDKANPADYYMDVLAGVVPHETNPNFNKEDLFLDWMVAPENPDAVPAEVAQATMNALKNHSTEEDKQKEEGGAVYKTYTKVKTTIRTHLSDLKKHLMKDWKKQEVTRETPSVMAQAKLLFRRATLQRLRNPFSTVLNIILMVIAGSLIPSLIPEGATMYIGIPKSLTENEDGNDAYLRQNVKPNDAIPSVLTNLYLFLTIVSCLSVNVLGSERTVFFRETAVGQSVFSYWLAKTVETIMWLPIYATAFVFLGYSNESWLLQSLLQYWIWMLLDLIGLYGIGMVCSLIVGAGSAALLTLVIGIIIVIGFSGTVNAYGDASSSTQAMMRCWFIFWSTQGVASEEYDIYRYAFDVDRLNDETPGKYENDFGGGQQAVGAGKGLGFDLSASYGSNVFNCLLTALAWHLIVLWTLKTKDHKNHR